MIIRSTFYVIQQWFSFIELLFLFFLSWRIDKTQHQLSKKPSSKFDSATSRIIPDRGHSQFKNLYVESNMQVLHSASTLQNVDYTQNLYAGHLPSDEIIYRRNDKLISFSKGKVIVL